MRRQGDYFQIETGDRGHFLPHKNPFPSLTDPKLLEVLDVVVVSEESLLVLPLSLKDEVVDCDLE